VSLKTLHQVIIFAAMTISIIFAIWGFTSSDAVGIIYSVLGIGCIFTAIALIGYEIHFLKRTKRLIIH
jgi:hypothetical protein